MLLIGGKTEPGCDRISGQLSCTLVLTFFIIIIILNGSYTNLYLILWSVWSFDTETECWSLMEAKGDIPVGLFK